MQKSAELVFRSKSEAALTLGHSSFIRSAVPTALIALLAAVLEGCGGGGGAGTTGPSSANTGSVINYAPIVVDAGPLQVNAVNTPYVTVTLCSPGSTTQCQTIDHILVDTGSTGFRVFASALGSGLTASQLKQSTDANGNALVECTQFVDGYSWGPVKTADLEIGGETARSVPIQVIGDPAYPSSLVPAACINVPDGEENTVLQFGANGVLGIGNFVQDCGPFCAAGRQDGSAYNVCSVAPTTSCAPAVVSLDEQVSNPVALFAADNNGVLIVLAPVSDTGAVSSTGTLIFGIGTQANNALGSATVYTLDPDYGSVLTTYAGAQLNRSFVDTGSNGYFFPDRSIHVCSDQSDFYCPSAPLALTARLQGANGALVDVAFAVSNADSMLAEDSVEPDLAGPASSSTLTSFDWGLPFFLGRNVYVALEGVTVGGVQGPADAF